MRSNRISLLSIPVVLLFVLVAYLAGARTAAAQAKPVNLIVAVFPGPDSAGAALAGMDASQRQQMESHAVVSKDKEGKLTVRNQSKTGQGETATANAQANKYIDGAVALLGRPLGPAPSGNRDTSKASAQTAGKTQTTPEARAAGVSDASAQQLQGMLSPGESALLLIVPVEEAPEMSTALKDADASEVAVIEIIPVP